MRISFSPALGHTTTVPVPRQASESDTVTLLFTATFEHEHDYAQAKQEGIRVEIWSDIPVADRSLGEWGALAFEELPSSSSRGASESFSLLPRSQAEATPKQNVLYLRIPARLHGQDCCSFTYRLVYPSGEIRWLGEYGRNGSLVIEHRDLRFNLRKGWRMEDDGTHIWQTLESCPEDVEVADLNNELDWSCWAIGGEGRLRSYSLYSQDNLPVQSSLLFLLPRSKDDSIICHRPLILSAPPGSSVSLTSSGIIKSQSSTAGSIRLRSNYLSADVQKFIEDDLTSSTHPYMRLISCSPSSGHIVLASAEPTQPTYVSIMSLLPAPSQVSIKMRTLTDLMSGGTRISLFSHASGVFRVFASPSEIADQEITFTSDQNGGEFVVAPVYTLDGGDKPWQISFVTPCVPVLPPSEPINRLPTPPPSPPIFCPPARTLEPPPRNPQKRVSFGEPIHSVIEDRPNDETSLMRLPEATSYLYADPHMQAQIMRYLSLILQTTAWFFTNIFIRIFTFLHATNLRHEIEYASIEDSEEPNGSATATDGGEHVNVEPEHPQEEPKAEPEPEPEPQQPMLCSEPETEIISPLPSSDHLLTPSGSGAVEICQTFGKWDGLAMPPFVDVPGGEVVMLMQCAGPIHQLWIELDGRPVRPDIKTLDEGTYLVELSGGCDGGRLMISLDHGQ